MIHREFPNNGWFSVFIQKLGTCIQLWWDLATKNCVFWICLKTKCGSKRAFRPFWMLTIIRAINFQSGFYETWDRMKFMEVSGHATPLFLIILIFHQLWNQPASGWGWRKPVAEVQDPCWVRSGMRALGGSFQWKSNTLERFGCNHLFCRENEFPDFFGGSSFRSYFGFPKWKNLHPCNMKHNPSVCFLAVFEDGGCLSPWIGS